MVARLRVVSLVPSLTETVAVSAPDLLVGVTDWCTHPAGLEAARVGGTKSPRVDDVLALRPDLVLANAEENRPADLDALRAAGIEVWLCAFTTVDEALAGLADLHGVLGLDHPAWLERARTAWADPWHGPRRTAVVPIWRRPWMALGRDTFAGDVLARIGVDNALAGAVERYPRIDPGGLPPHDVVVLPDEPYPFTGDDGPEAFEAPARLVSGRDLTWYGPSLATAREALQGAVWA